MSILSNRHRSEGLDTKRKNMLTVDAV